MTNHTPGPWEVYEAHGRYDNVGAPSGHVATCEDPIDAPLIAAAPDLLAALKTIVADAESGQCEMDVITIARAAIAKAENTDQC